MFWWPLRKRSVCRWDGPVVQSTSLSGVAVQTYLFLNLLCSDQVDSGSFTDFLAQVDPKGDAVDISENILGSNLSWIYTIAYMLIGIGSFVFLVGFMGCCGAIKEWRPLLVGVSCNIIVAHVSPTQCSRAYSFQYAICLIIIMCFEIGIGIAVGVYKDQVIGELKVSLKRDLVSKYHYIATNVDADGKLTFSQPPAPISPTERIATNSLNSMFVAVCSPS